MTLNDSPVSDATECDNRTDSSPAPSSTPLGGRIWFLIILLSLVGQIAWAVENNFFNLFIQDVFGASLSDVALMVSASALTAAVTTLLVGVWSDRVGRRKIFIVVGTLLWAASIAVFAILQEVSGALVRDAVGAATLGITLTIIFDCVMTFFGSSANDSTYNAWLTDVTDDTNRGKVEGVNSAMPLLSMLVVFGGSMFLMVVGEDGSVTYDYSAFFLIIAAIVLVCGIVAAVVLPDSHPVPQRNRSYFDDIAYGFKPSSMRTNTMLYLVLLAYCIFAIAMQVFMPYYVLYLRLPYILGENYVFVMAPCIILAAGFTIIYARRMDKIGFSRSIVIPMILFLAGCVVLAFVQAAAGVFVGSLLMLCGYLGAVACFGAEIRNNTPSDRVGLFQGLRIVMIVLIPMLIGPWIGSAISAGSASMVGFGVVGDGFTPSSLIFLGGAAVGALTFIVLAIIAKKRRTKR